MKATEKQIRKFFEKVGKVRDVIMIRDKYTNRHKGYAYVELNDLESVPMVLMLNGTVPDFQRFPILVKASEAEKNFLAKQESAAAAEQQAEIDQRAAAPRRKLLVGNLHPNITEGDLRTVLAPFGDVESVDMSTASRSSPPSTRRSSPRFYRRSNYQQRNRYATPSPRSASSTPTSQRLRM